MSALEYLSLAGFAALMTAAAIEDFRRLIIPNPLTLALCVLWPAYFAASPSLAGGFAALGCALAVFAVGALCFARGYLGGGDVKLLAAAALWAGPAATPDLLLVTAIVGGLLALALVSPFLAPVFAAARLALGATAPAATNLRATPVPYGVAIAAAALIVILPPHFG